MNSQTQQNTNNQRFESNYTVDQKQIEMWVETFHQTGCLFLEEVLTEDHCAQLRKDLSAKVNTENPESGPLLHHRMFEDSPANLNLFDLEPIVSFAEALVAPNCHVIHNNSFITPPGGGLSSWHQDDKPHLIITDDKPPKNIRLPVLFFTANYYLTDVTEIEHGGTETILSLIHI